MQKSSLPIFHGIPLLHGIYHSPKSHISSGSQASFTIKCPSLHDISHGICILNGSVVCVFGISIQIELYSSVLLAAACIFFCSTIAEAAKIGVNYGMDANNLPPPDQVVNMLKSNNIGKMRIFSANHAALEPFKNSGIDVIVGGCLDVQGFDKEGGGYRN
eukprot:Gb_08452 [translate_table: standard]